MRIIIFLRPAVTHVLAVLWKTIFFEKTNLFTQLNFLFLLPWYSYSYYEWPYLRFPPCQSMSKVIDYYYSNLSITPFTPRTLKLHYHISGSWRGAQVPVPPPGQLVLPDVRVVLGVFRPQRPQSRNYSLQSGLWVSVWGRERVDDHCWGK